MLKTVHIVTNIIGGIVDSTEAFAKEKDADARYRELICENSPWTGAEMADSYRPDQEQIWQKDNFDYLYDSEKDLYYPRSTERHDVAISEATVSYGEE